MLFDNIKRTLIPIMLLISFTFLYSSVSLQKIGKSIDPKIINNKITSLYVNNLILKDSIIYLSSQTSRNNFPFDSIAWSSIFLIKYNLSGDLSKNYYIKEIIDTAGALYPKLLNINQDNSLSLYSTHCFAFQLGLVGDNVLDVRKYDEYGNQQLHYRNEKSPRNFFNAYRMVKFKDILIAISQQKSNQNTPYINVRYNMAGVFLDSSETIPVYIRGDTVLQIKVITVSEASRLGKVAIYASTYVLLTKSNGSHDFLDLYNSLILLDSKQKIKWEIKFTDSVGSDKSTIYFLGPPAFFSNGDIMMLGFDYIGTDSLAKNNRLIQMRIDTNGNIISKKIFKEKSRFQPCIDDIFINKNDEAIIVGRADGSEMPDAYIAKIDNKGNLVFEDIISQKPYSLSLSKITEYAPNNYLIAAREIRVHNGGDDQISFYKWEDKTADVQEAQATENIVYPNPAGDYLNIKDIENISGDVEIHNIAGKTVMQVPAASKIDIRILPAGVYYVTINGKTEKFVKK